MVFFAWGHKNSNQLSADSLRIGVGMNQAAADGSAVADLKMADERYGSSQERVEFSNQCGTLDGPLPCQRADP